MRWDSHSHSYGETGLHLQFTPKYRKAIFRSDAVREACRKEFKEIAKRLGVRLEAAEFGPDHTHIFVTDWKNYSPAKLANRFKGASSRAIRKAHRQELIRRGLWGDSMWTDGYFHETVGSVTADARKFYIERCQGKHWEDDFFMARPKSQTSLASFSS